MTTHTYTSTFSQATDADFRAWGGDLSAALTTVGAIKTADTGQIDWATTTIPGSNNTAAGYEIRIINDSLHATAPIYLKVEYGRGSAATVPSMWVTLGTGSNGSGTLTGVFAARFQFATSSTAIASTSTPYPTYVCMVDGCLWWALKVGGWSSVSDRGFHFAVMRTVDDSGDPTPDGAVYYQPPSANFASNATSYTFSTAYTRSSGPSLSIPGGNYSLMPYGITETVVSGVPGYFQSTRHYAPFPTIRPMQYVVSSNNGDGITLGSVVDATPVGTTARTYLCVRNSFSFYDRFCLIWE